MKVNLLNVLLINFPSSLLLVLEIRRSYCYEDSTNNDNLDLFSLLALTFGGICSTVKIMRIKIFLLNEIKRKYIVEIPTKQEYKCNMNFGLHLNLST